MKRLTKKIATSIMALTLVIAMGTTCFGATWGSYIGGEEATAGKVTANKASGFTIALDPVGYGEVWGAQVFLNCETNPSLKKYLTIKKNHTYTLAFDIKATNITKYVYLKIAKGETLAYAQWVKLTGGKTTKVNVSFKAKANADSVYFGLAGDVGTRTDNDAETRYAIFQKQFKKSAEDMNDTDGEYAVATNITVSKFILIEQPKVKSAKSRKKGKVTVKVAKVPGAKKYVVKVGTKKKTTSKTSITLKAKSKKKVKVQVAVISKLTGVTSPFVKYKKKVKVK